jgi:hypothetical protein
LAEDNLCSPLEALSNTFLEAAKLDRDLAPYVSAYELIEFEQLQNDLCTDEEKKSFWINSYNAFTLVLIKRNNGSYGNRTSFFRDKHFTIAATPFSLDDIEHGILRRGKYKYSLGFFNKIWSPLWEKKLWVDKLDFRIHFALNCGATSCPPIKFYSSDKIDIQLDLASISYLKKEVNFDEANNIIYLPAIFKWFAADFGNTSDVLSILKKYKLISTEADPEISFKNYDWDVSENPFGNKSSL